MQKIFNYLISNIKIAFCADGTFNAEELVKKQLTICVRDSYIHNKLSIKSGVIEVLDERISFCKRYIINEGGNVK
ncbi:MAG: hypothetical protein PVG74_17740 [Desulfobacterales bacterium]